MSQRLACWCKFCTACGKALPSPCPGCGAANPVGAKFCGDCGAKLERPAFAHVQLTPPKRSTSTIQLPGAERRQVTVMFCDLVGSTGLSARLDPEEMRELIAIYRNCVTEAVARFDGFVAQHLGDGVLAYFGYPQAHEDDAERAVRAGLAAVVSVESTKTNAAAGLKARVGIATGLVVVGEQIGGGDSQERVAIGDTPNSCCAIARRSHPRRCRDRRQHSTTDWTHVRLRGTWSA